MLRSALGVRNRSANRGLIAFTAESSFAHAALMTVDVEVFEFGRETCVWKIGQQAIIP
jgi:hypothetical protein